MVNNNYYKDGKLGLSTHRECSDLSETGVLGVYYNAARGKIGPWLHYPYHCVETGKGMESKFIKFCKTTDFFSGKSVMKSLTKNLNPLNCCLPFGKTHHVYSVTSA